MAVVAIMIDGSEKLGFVLLSSRVIEGVVTTILTLRFIASYNIFIWFYFLVFQIPATNLGALPTLSYILSAIKKD